MHFNQRYRRRLWWRVEYIGRYRALRVVQSILNQLDFADDQLMGPAQMGTGGEAAEISCPTFPLHRNHNRRMRRT
jgi:hypothetical protein